MRTTCITWANLVFARGYDEARRLYTHTRDSAPFSCKHEPMPKSALSESDDAVSFPGVVHVVDATKAKVIPVWNEQS